MARSDGSSISSLEDRVYSEMRAMIVQGTLRPGEQIVQEALAERLGVSRTPLRKAIAALTQENFLEMNARGEAYVRSFTHEELNSIWEIRSVLEGLVCRMAAHHAKPQHLAYLRALITSAANQATSDDWTPYREADKEFHRYLAQIVHDPLLDRILDSFQILSITLAQGLLRPPEETLPEHLGILDALQARKADRAEQAMVDHIRASIRHLNTASSPFKIAEALPSNFMQVVKEAAGALADKLKETVVVVCQDRSEAAIVHQVHASKALRVILEPDTRLPLHASAPGKVLLAWKEKDELHQLLKGDEFKRFTPNTLTHREALLGALQHIRDQGYGLEDEEHEMGVRGIAAPVRSRGRVIAAVYVLVPAARLENKSSDAHASEVVACARTISEQL